jgi:hypothetical protein
VFALKKWARRFSGEGFAAMSSSGLSSLLGAEGDGDDGTSNIPTDLLKRIINQAISDAERLARNGKASDAQTALEIAEDTMRYFPTHTTDHTEWEKRVVRLRKSDARLRRRADK